MKQPTNPDTTSSRHSRSENCNVKELLVREHRYRRTEVILLSIAAGIIAILLGFLLVLETGHIKYAHQYSDGAVFSGYWRFGEPYGKGLLATQTGKLYEGVWDEKGNLTQGTLIARDYTYVGDFRDYLPQGFGSCRYLTGDSYYGQWADGYKNGIGKYLTADGELKFGRWEKGTLLVPEGQEYEAGSHIYGMDVSNHQKSIDWETLALFADNKGVVNGTLKSSPYLQPVLFALVKSTEGADMKTESFTRNFEEAKRVGIVRGAYHFMRTSDIDRQIKNFIDNTPLEKGDLPPVLDLELSHRTMRREGKKVRAYAHKWLEAMEKHYGVRPILYTYETYYNDYLKGHGFEKYDFFIARYNPEIEPRVPHLEIWQFTEKGTVEGITTNVDLDVFVGDYRNFEEYVATKGIQ